MEKEINNKHVFFFFFHSPKWSSTSIQVHKCQHLFVFFLPGLYPFHSDKYITGYYSVFSNRNYIFCRRVCFRGIGFAVIYSGKTSREAQLAFFRLRHFASQSIRALSDKSVPFQRAVTSETAKAWLKLWAWPRFQGNLRKVNTDTRPFHPRSLVFFFQRFAIRVCLIFQEAYKICGRLLFKASTLQTPKWGVYDGRTWTAKPHLRVPLGLKTRRRTEDGASDCGPNGGLSGGPKTGTG